MTDNALSVGVAQTDAPPSVQPYRAEEFTRSILDHTIEAIIGVDPQGLIQSFNRAAERMFLHTERDVLGQPVSLLMPKPERRRNSDESEHLRIADGRISGLGREVVGLRGDGSRFPMDLAVTPFVVDGAVHATWIVRDMTESKRLEEQLRQSQKMEAMGQLAGGVAHDFNNLLTVITGYCETLTGPSSSPDDRRVAVDQIMNAAARAANLTNQLLSFSRKAVVVSRVLDLNAIIEDIGRMLRRVIGEDICLEAVTSKAPAFVRGDAGQMGQVLVNLAVNARDAMPHGGRLTISTDHLTLDAAAAADRRVTAGEYVLLTVSDTGVGIAPDILPRIFEPFFTTKAPGRGTGLGLATVYGIVHQAGGELSVQSQPGKGASFSIVLPVARPEAAAATVSVPAKSSHERGSETVLVVEDEARVRDITVRMLEARGYHVLSAADGSHALALAQEHGHIDLLVSDVIMPDVSGPQVAERLRTAHPDMRMLFVSGYSDDAVVRHGVHDAGLAFLQKPYTGSQLACKIREILDTA